MRLFTILIIAVLLRLGVAFLLGDTVPPAKDEQSYSELATRLVNGYGYSFEESWYPFTPADTPTSHWSFLYTAVTATIYLIFGSHPLAARLVGAVFGGMLLPWMVYRLARRLFPGEEQLALLSAFCSAVYAFFILYSAMIMTETFYITAVLWSMERALALADVWRQGEWPSWRLLLSFGVSLGTAALLRQSVLPWVAVLFLWLLGVDVSRKTVETKKKQLIQRTSELMLAGGIMLAFILPFTIRNYLVYDDFLLLNSNAGYAMYSAQHPMHGTDFQAFDAAPLPEELLPVDSLTEAQWDRELMRRGVGFILADPGRYLLLSASRVLDYFEFWPTETTLLHNIGRLASFTLFAPFMVAGLVIAARREKAGRNWKAFLSTPVFLTLLFIVFYSFLHIFTWAMPRYRLPVDTVTMPFVALAVSIISERVRNRGQKSVTITIT